MLYTDTSAGNVNLGVDVDGTLTKEVMGKEVLGLSLEELEKMILGYSPKNGIDVLLEISHNVHIITGRQEKLRDTTTEWLDMYGIPYKDLNMFPDNFYKINGWSVPKYVEMKLCICAEKKIQFALDDNDDMVKALNVSGIPTCKVDDNFRHAFDKLFDIKRCVNGDK